jgi:GT2 family glycosyltransferase
MRLAQGAYLMPLNFDIEMTPRFLEEMVVAIERSPSIGIVTGKLRQMAANGERTERLYSTGHVMPLNRFARHRGAGERDIGQYDRVSEVFGASGAAALYRREMLDDVGYRGCYFDESLFMWYEDVDLDWRARKLGWKCLYTPDAVAYHVGHPEGHEGDPWQIATTIRNRWLVVLANDDLSPFRRKTGAMLAYEAHLVWYILTNGHWSAYCEAVLGFLKLLPSALQKRRWMTQRLAAQGELSSRTRRQSGSRI